MKAFIGVLLTVAPMVCGAQNLSEFKKAFGGPQTEELYSLVESRLDSGLFLFGSTDSFGAGENDFLLLKTDRNGKRLWAKTYGAKKEDNGRHLARLSGGEYLMVGYSESFNQSFKEILVVKFTENGKTIWAKTFGLDRSDFAIYVQPTIDGGFIILGETINNINHEKNQDIILIKANKAGNVEWSKIYGGTRTEYVYGIKQTSDSGYIVSGETNSFGAGDWDAMVVKIRSDGEVQWAKTYGGPDADYGRFAVQTSDGNYLLAGNTVGFSSPGIDMFECKLNPNGELIWAKTLSGDGTDYALELKNTPNGVLLAGYSNSSGIAGEDAILVCLNPTDGKILWTKAFGGGKSDYGVTLNLTATSDILLGGTTNSEGAGKDDMFIVKVPLHWPRNPCFSTNFKLWEIPIKPKSSDAKIYSIDLHVIYENVLLESKDAPVDEFDLCPTRY